MKYRLQDLIDMEHFQNLQDRLNEIYSFPSAIIDNDGNILTATAWQDVCTQFHRKNKDSEQHCIKSDQYIQSHLYEANPAVSYRCPHGLVDNATPIIIDGIHYGNFFTGQFFLEEPDIDFFRDQAKKYGFDKDAYLEAVKRVPIWTQEQLNNYLFFIKGLIAVISESGLKKFREMETRKQIQESEERHRSILQTAMDGFCLTDTKGRLLEVNDAYCRMSGYSKDELLTMCIADLEAVEIPQITAMHMQKIAWQGVESFESKHRRKDGTVFDIELSVQFRPEEGGRFVCFLRDITERKLAEEALMNSERKWRHILVNAPQIGITLDRDARIVFTNTHFQTLTGWKEEEIIGQDWFDLFIPEKIREEIRNVFKSVTMQKDTPGYSTYENDIVTRSGEMRHISWANVLTKDIRGDILDVTCLGIDLTEREQTEKLLTALNIIAQSINQSLDLDQVLNTALNEVMKVFKLHSANIRLIDNQTQELVLAAHKGFSPEELKKVPKRLKPNEGAAGLSRKLGKIVIMEDLLNDPRADILCIYAIEMGCRSLAVFPLKIKDKMVGVMSIRTPEPRSYGDDEIKYFESIGNQIGTAIENARLYQETQSTIKELQAEVRERKKGELQLLKSEQKYRHLFNNAEVGMFRTKPDGSEMLDLNERLLEIFGRTREEMLGTPSLNYWADPLERQEMVRRIAAEGRVRNFECKMLNRRGEIRQCLASLRLYREQAILEGSITDITERRQAEEALKESEAKYRCMMESMDDAVYICSKDFRIEYMNPAMIKRIGRDATGETCYQTMHGLDKNCPWCIHEKVMRGETINTEVKSPKDNRIYHVSNSPISHTHGSISKLTMFRDITETKKIEERLQQAQKMESIGTLAGGIAHDFNNILSPIMVHSELAVMDLPADSPVRQNLYHIYKAGERARDLVQQILTFARRRGEDRIPLKASLIIKDVVKFMRSAIPSTIHIQYDFKTEHDTILADPTQISQIVMNLCTNATHAMREKGGVLDVNLSDEYIEAGMITAPSCLTPGHYLRLSVSDTGQGISPEVIDKIFEPYFTTKDPGEGTGMGLAIVHGIVRSYDGDIEVEIKPDKGTAFHVWIPLVEVVAPPIIAPGEDLPKGNERILFVDDEKAAVYTVQMMLEKIGYKVTTRTNGIEALEAFRNAPDGFDLVITDMTMPKMTGKDLAKKLMAIRPEIPIILYTGYSEQIDARKANKMGIRAFVMKPIVMRDMAKTIREVLDQKP